MKKREVQGGIERPRVGITNAVNHSQYRSEPSAERSQLDLYKRWRLPVVIFVLLMVTVAVDQIWVHVWRFVPVSYDTTRLMGPVSKDGGINYVRALNQLARRGVTSKNDAAVLLIKAVGPKLFPAEVWYDKDILWQLDMQPNSPILFYPLFSSAVSIFPSNLSRPSRIVIGCGGQPGMKRSMGTTLAAPLLTSAWLM